MENVKRLISMLSPFRLCRIQLVARLSYVAIKCLAAERYVYEEYV